MSRRRFAAKLHILASTLPAQGRSSVMTQKIRQQRAHVPPLREQHIVSTPAMARRGVLATMAGAVAATVAGTAEAQNYTGVSDQDWSGRGPYRDREGFGRNFSGPGRGPNRPWTGYSDHDPSDAAGHGAIPPGGNQRLPGIPGAPGNRAYTGYSDRDPTDLAGYGQRRNQQVRCTDRDPGDPINGGRNCR